MQLFFDAFWFSFLSLIIICCVELLAGSKFCLFFLLLLLFPFLFIFALLPSLIISCEWCFFFFKNKCLILWIPYSAKWKKAKKKTILNRMIGMKRGPKMTKTNQKICVRNQMKKERTTKLRDSKLFYLFPSSYNSFLNVLFVDFFWNSNELIDSPILIRLMSMVIRFSTEIGSDGKEIVAIPFSSIVFFFFAFFLPSLLLCHSLITRHCLI